MPTTNLELEEIELTDRINTDMLQKINGNMNKLDVKYGELKEGLFTKTGKTTIEEAVAYVGQMADEIANKQAEINRLNSIGDATTNEIMNGKTALVQGQEITGEAFSQTTTATEGDIASGKTAYANDGTLIIGTYTPPVPIPTINVTLTGTYANIIGGYGAGIDQNGTLVIWAFSTSTGYEHVSFIEDVIEKGTIGEGWRITAFDTADPTNVPHACTINNIVDVSTININLNANYENSSSDYVRLAVTLTAS